MGPRRFVQVPLLRAVEVPNRSALSRQRFAYGRPGPNTSEGISPQFCHGVDPSQHADGSGLHVNDGDVVRQSWRFETERPLASLAPRLAEGQAPRTGIRLGSGIRYCWQRSLDLNLVALQTSRVNSRSI